MGNLTVAIGEISIGIMKNKFIATFVFMASILSGLKAQKLFTLEELNFGGKNHSVSVPEDWGYSWQGHTLVLNKDGKRQLQDPSTGKFQEGSPAEKVKNPKNKGSLEWNPVSGADAILKENNLYVRYADGQEVQLSKDGSRELVYGQSVHRDEFGIQKGVFWSPDGQKLAYYRMDQSMVADYPQVNTFEREATYEPDKYPMAGRTSHQVTVFVFDLQTQKTTQLAFGDPTDRYFSNIAWSPDAKTLYLYELNRDQNFCTLDAYDVALGVKKKTLYSESSDKYVEPLHPITFLPWDSSKFVYWSWKDGFRHLYLMDVEGKELGQLTEGTWDVKESIMPSIPQKEVTETIATTKESRRYSRPHPLTD